MQSITLLLVIIVLIGTLLSTTYADLPVHCKESQMAGQWEIYMTKLSSKISRKRCFKMARRYRKNPSTFKGASQKLRFHIDERSHHVKANDSDHVIGRYTMVYDQGIELRLKDDAHRHLTLFAVPNYKTFYHGGKLRKIRSMCSDLSIGWLKVVSSSKKGKDSVQYGCFMGKKLNPQPSDIAIHRPINELIKSRNKDNVHALSESMFSPVEEEADDASFKNDHAFISQLNAHQKDWKAAPYLPFEKYTNEEMRRRMGMHTGARHIVEQQARRATQLLDDDLVTTNDASTTAAGVTSRSDRSRIAREFPKSWDWRNVDGINYVSPIRDQQACGSCYIVSSVDAIESRLRIMTNNQWQPRLSAQEIISCNPYTQRCHGGFPFLVGKYGKDFGLVPESCMPYEGKNSTCSARCDNPEYRVFIDDYNYIGGSYGGSSEYRMMRELYEHGPIVVSFFVHRAWTYYRRGIYHRVRSVMEEGFEKTKSFTQPWVPTTHSVSIVGWGEEPASSTNDSPVPYWIVKNSWGNTWGDRGFIKMRRGVDDSFIESQTVALYPRLPPQFNIYPRFRHQSLRR